MIRQILSVRPIPAGQMKSALLLLMVAAIDCCIAQTQTATSPQPAEPLAPAELVIGVDQGGRLEYFNPGNGKWSEVPTQGNTSAVDLNLGAGPNGQGIGAWHDSAGGWSADCSRNTCKIVHADDNHREFSISRKGVLSPLHFSPDGDRFFFIKKVSAWRVPPKCHLEDEFAVYVRDVGDKKENFVTSLCGGFPYQSLRWYRLKPRSVELTPR